MSEQAQSSDGNAIEVFNYCASFIDLLGQRAALQGQGARHEFESEAEKEKFETTVRRSVGAIKYLQTQAEILIRPMLTPNLNSPLRLALPPDQRAIWDEMQRTQITTQRWSDGLVIFACLGYRDVPCKMNNVFGILGQTGSLCLLGLSARQPLRGAIEVAWGVELNPGELYGAVVARAYELESEVAQYPRIVVGPEAVKFLEHHSATSAQDVYSQSDRALAEKCLGMLAYDEDGHVILHYLGHAFQQAVTKGQHAAFYADAREFVNTQLAEHQASLNSKLAFRYAHLLRYFHAHPFQAQDRGSTRRPVRMPRRRRCAPVGWAPGCFVRRASRGIDRRRSRSAHRKREPTCSIFS